LVITNTGMANGGSAPPGLLAEVEHRPADQGGAGAPLQLIADLSRGIGLGVGLLAVAAMTSTQPELWADRAGAAVGFLELGLLDGRLE
jgi:hypothetical protein